LGRAQVKVCARGKDTLSCFMSFRRRLLLSFFLILIVPIIALAVVGVALTQESRGAKTDARISGALPAVVDEYRAALAQGDAAGAEVARDPAFLAALGAPASQRDRLLRRTANERDLESIDVLQAGESVAAVSGDRPVAVAQTNVRAPDGTAYTLLVSTTTADEFRAAAERVAGLPVAVGSGDDILAVGQELDPGVIALDGPPPQSVDVANDSADFRARVIELRNQAGPPVRIALAAPLGESVLTGNGNGLLIAVAFASFLLLAAAAVIPLMRGLDQEHISVKAQASTDGLTGLANHRRFQETIAQEAGRSERYRHDLSMLMMDLDNFKSINDTHGHPQGDEVLRRVSEVVRAECRNIDIAARYGGEEFAILLPATPIARAAEVGERIRRRLAETAISVEGTDEALRVTASIGVAGTPDHPLVAGQMIEAADRGLYEAKGAGKDRVVRAEAVTQAPIRA